MRQIPSRAWRLAIAAGLLQVLIFPSAFWYVLSWVALAPLLVAVLGPARTADASADRWRATTGQGFWIGYASGVIFYGGTCYWVFHVMHIYGGLAPPVAAGVLVLFCLYLGLYHGLFGALLAFAAREPRLGPNRALAVAPFLWVAVELARARVTGFPWDLLGYAQVENIPVSLVATVTGVYGVSFIIAAVNTAVAAAWLLPAGGRWKLGVAAGAAAVLLQSLALYRPAPLPVTHSARLVQQNIPILNHAAWTPDFFDRVIFGLVQLSRGPQPAAQSGAAQAGGKQAPGASPSGDARGGNFSGPRLIVWPESPAPFYTNDPKFYNWVSALASDTDSYVIAGSLGVRQPEAATAAASDTPLETAMYNSAAVVAPSGNAVARYDKIHLVPFGEYVPFQSLLVFAEKLTREVSDFSRGSERVVFRLQGPRGDARVAVFICYESIFPDEIRQFAARGAQVFINISNDGWFGETGAPWQHLNMARMRAIENNRWVLRATNTGVTASIDPLGRVVAVMPRNQQGALEAPYALREQQTLYTRGGDVFAFTCVIISLLGLFVRPRPRATQLRIVKA